MTADRTFYRALAIQAEIIREGNSFSAARADRFSEVIEEFATRNESDRAVGPARITDTPVDR